MFSILSLVLISCSEVDDSTAEYSFLQSHTDPASISVTLIPSEIDRFNNPATVLGESYEKSFRELPTRGHIGYQPWSGSYWPKYKGGISYRWKTEESHNLDLLSKDEVQSADISVIEGLSPAEKYDLLVGNYDWSLTHAALAASNPNEPTWAGYCHGWSPASLAYEEPKPIVMENEDGVRIPFGSSDIKALLTFYRGEVVTSDHVSHEWRSETKGIGSLCGSNLPTDPTCYDTNPAAFHIILANQIGIRGEGFNIDVESTRQKWNQPVFAYESEIVDYGEPSGDASSEAHLQYTFATQVSWGLEIEPTYIPVVNTNHQSVKVETYYYTIEVDALGTIIGGQWLTKTRDGGFVSLGQAWEILSTLDENNDGVPDYNTDAVSSIIWEHFSFPDYVWTQEDVDFPEAFEPLSSPYALIAMTRSSRQELYDYFGKLEELYTRSLR